MPHYPFPGVAPAVPEIVLAGLAMALLLLGAFRGENSTRQVTWLAVAALTVVFILNLVQGGEQRLGFYGMFVSDAFAVFMKSLVLIGSAVTILMGVQYDRDERIERFEFPVLVMLATTGMMVMISANDLIILYAGLELQNLALYVAASFNRDSARSSEAGLKYFILSGLSSGILLYGLSLVYGFADTTAFTDLARLFASGAPVSRGVIVGLAFIIAGLAFKISAVPFHMWTPDVYEGAPSLRILRACPENRCLCAVRPRADRAVRGALRRMATNGGFHVGCFDGVRRGRGDSTAEHQTPDGL
jgi:NADH-quinone oxidoreductase subunit N